MDAPERQGLVQEAKGVVTGTVLRGRQEVFEPPDVDVVGIDRQAVAAGLGDELGGLRQTAAQTGHLGAQRACGIVGELVAPELFDEPIRRHGPVRFEKEDREQPAVGAARDANRLAAVDHLERPEDPKAGCPRAEALLPPPSVPPAATALTVWSTGVTG